ncbi:MAG: hypothetical protein AB1898_09225 [Acidobacteriota bacterium]
MVGIIKNAKLLYFFLGLIAALGHAPVLRGEDKASILARLEASEAHPPRSRIFASANTLVPVMANNPGLFGAYFKTKVSIYNPTPFSYPLEVTLYPPSGSTSQRTLTMNPRQVRNYENFLQEVFGYTGAGAVEFDSWFGPPGGSADFDFIVTAEVYTDSPNGRYKTVVTVPEVTDLLSTTYASYTLGITVDGNTRTNIGCVNESVATTVRAELYDAGSRLIQAYRFNLARTSWLQGAINENVQGGYIKWIPDNGFSCTCYAVTVDNRSNDGTFILPTKYVP